ncbi:MAG: polysaccharide deacetylase family protein [Ignavibacteriales bacterium]|nr:MAG: polysaccharide deacetylase family protein [Ignavibacteriales bacterium]
MKMLFPDFIWNTKNDKVLLTFDDGPNPNSTEIILTTLEQMNIKGLFFCVGNNVDKYTSLAKDILSAGHSIGNHTFNHKIISKIRQEDVLTEIKSMNNVVVDKLSYQIKYFRPPHGKFRLNTSSLMKEVKMKNVMWSLLTYDFQYNLSLVNNSVHRFLKSDSIIVLHDSNKSKDIIRDSILFIADEVNNRGLAFGDTEECLN